MFKLLFVGALIYYAYHFLISPPALDDHSEDNDSFIQHKKSDPNDDEYVDYEEVD